MAGLLGTISGQVRLDIRQAVAAYATLRAQNAKTVYALRGASESFIGAGRSMVVGGGLMVGAFGLAVKAAAEFERKMDFFGAVTGTNEKRMKSLSKFTLQLAQDTIYSANEIADGFIELGKAGVSAQQIIDGIGVAVTNLGAAGDIPLAQSGQIITSTIQQFDLAAQDAVHVTDLLAGAANASIADISDIGVSLKYVGGVANAAGLTFEDTATAISLLAKAGIRGSTAGTSLRQMIVSLGGATKPAKDALKELGIITADNNNLFYTQAGRLKPLSQVFQILQDHLDGFNQKEKLAYLRTIFNNRALAAAALLTRDGAKGFKQMYGAMGKVKAADVAHQRLDNLSGDLEILRGNIETLMIQAGGPFQKTARQWVQSLTKLIQAFSDLDPKTQQNIIQFIGVTGAALVALGVFNILLGTVLKFAANMLKMGAAVRLVIGFLFGAGDGAGILTVAFTGLAAVLGVTVGVLALIVAAVAAFIAVWIIAYKKIKPFQVAVNAYVGALKAAAIAFYNFIRLLAKDPGAAWDKIKRAAKQALDYIIQGFGKLKGYVTKGLNAARSAVSSWIDSVVNWFKALPGRVLTALGRLLLALSHIFTLSNVLSFLGTAIGKIVGFFSTLPFKILGLMVKLVTSIIIAWARLVPGIAGFVGHMVGFLIGLALRLQLRWLKLVGTLVGRTIVFFSKLPGRVAAIVGRMASFAIKQGARLAHELPGLASRAVQAFINFMAKLPGRVANLMGRVVSTTRRLLSKLPGLARQFGYGIYNGLSSAISGLPGLVSGVLGNVISAFKAVIKAGFNAAKSFAKGLWEGFKAGLGMHSPSHIERAMWQITGTVVTETKKIAKQVDYMNRLAARAQGMDYSTGGFRHPYASPAANQLVKHAAMHDANQKRSQRFLTARQAAPRRADQSFTRGTQNHARPVHITGKLRLDGSDAYIEGIVEDVLGEADHVDAMTARRRTARD